MDLPGKRRLERKLIRRKRVLSAINWLRAKFNQPPLVVDEDEAPGGSRPGSNRGTTVAAASSDPAVRIQVCSNCAAMGATVSEIAASRLSSTDCASRSCVGRVCSRRPCAAAAAVSSAPSNRRKRKRPSMAEIIAAFMRAHARFAWGFTKLRER